LQHQEHRPRLILPRAPPPLPLHPSPFPPQALLSAIAGLSEEQERGQRQLLLLDGSIAALASAIPLCQALACSGNGGAPAPAPLGRLQCSLRPLALRSQALGGGSDSCDDRDELAVEVLLQNDSRLAMEPGWSLLLMHRPPPGGGGGCALAAPLPRLAPGASWRRECRVPLAQSGRGGAALGALHGQLAVLLCRHSAAEGGGGAVAMLHGLQLDTVDPAALCGSGNGGRSGGGIGNASGVGQPAALADPFAAARLTGPPLQLVAAGGEVAALLARHRAAACRALDASQAAPAGAARRPVSAAAAEQLEHALVQLEELRREAILLRQAPPHPQRQGELLRVALAARTAMAALPLLNA
jgi:hypothetical protein